MGYEMYLRNVFSHDVSSFLTKLTTYQGYLPQGTPSSTTIAKLAFVPTRLELQARAEREGLRYTIFVINVTMSSQNDFQDVFPEIVQTITLQGFRLAKGR